MDILISWSGELSRLVGEQLRLWLPRVLQAVNPFFSPNDIDKGKRWGAELSGYLETCEFGVFVLTHENLRAPWLMFEAGALSKRVGQGRVCTLLIGVNNSDVVGPLTQFQSTIFDEQQVRQLVRDMNSALGAKALEDAHLTEAFDMWWPRLRERVAEIQESYVALNGTPSDVRSERDILEELLGLARRAAANSAGPDGSRDAERFFMALAGLVQLIERSRTLGQPSLIPPIRQVYLALVEVINGAEHLRNSNDVQYEMSRVSRGLAGEPMGAAA